MSFVHRLLDHLRPAAAPGPLDDRMAELALGVTTHVGPVYGLDLTPDAARLADFTAALTRWRTDRPVDDLTVLTFGAWLGETVRHTIGSGLWREDRFWGPVLDLPVGPTVLPMQTVRRQLGAPTPTFADVLPAVRQARRASPGIWLRGAPRPERLRGIDPAALAELARSQHGALDSWLGGPLVDLAALELRMTAFGGHATPWPESARIALGFALGVLLQPATAGALIWSTRHDEPVLQLTETTGLPLWTAAHGALSGTHLPLTDLPRRAVSLRPRGKKRDG